MNMNHLKVNVSYSWKPQSPTVISLCLVHCMEKHPLTQSKPCQAISVSLLLSSGSQLHLLTPRWMLDVRTSLHWTAAGLWMLIFFFWMWKCPSFEPFSIFSSRSWRRVCRSISIVIQLPCKAPHFAKSNKSLLEALEKPINNHQYLICYMADSEVWGVVYLSRHISCFHVFASAQFWGFLLPKWSLFVRLK